MAEILIKATDYIHPDPVKDRQGVHKVGDIVAIRPDGWSDGPYWSESQMCYAKAGKFVLVKCPGLAVDTAAAWTDPWRDAFDYEITAQNAAQGRYTVRVWETNSGASNQNGMTAAKIDAFLTSWGCTNMAYTTNSCSFVFRLWAAVQSSGFWEVPSIASLATFTEVAYSATTGIGRIQVVVTDATLAESAVLAAILARGGTLVTNAFPTVVFDIERSALLQKFRDDVKQKAERVFTRHRFAIPVADVDAAIAAGGIVTLTPAQLTAILRDKVAL